ncbi:hypothetical protein P167DRAFT_90795 [Morchella conica CCBAS932]|uniref:Uncharacterized protein n=1 Tax=Morchella conica CCBAS932 TaxID=1392247 RepID=A0A3N4L7P7_9PEZI|nr:hypothetical protein P167DRAFT_90795 [Morchella conica CCBAS932]
MNDECGHQPIIGSNHSYRIPRQIWLDNLIRRRGGAIGYLRARRGQWVGISSFFFFSFPFVSRLAVGIKGFFDNDLQGQGYPGFPSSSYTLC